MTSLRLRFPKWVGVVCDDLEAQRAFYRDVLGLREAQRGDGWVQFDIGSGKTFELIARSAEPQYDRPRYQVGFAVDDIEASRDELVNRGVELVADTTKSTSSWTYFRDPEGNVFEITERH
ncbi:MAG: VOC family protein [Candidatus Dormibacteraeota bacterium]|nr:VOC family protein [Candidatus Dormibacteraeota bacterium]